MQINIAVFNQSNVFHFVVRENKTIGLSWNGKTDVCFVSSIDSYPTP